MKAAIRSKYGPPKVLSVQEVETPTPKDNEVLIRIHATTVNRSDCHVLRGMPFAMRFFTGLFKPRYATTGSDFAGQIEAVGKDVKTFRVGDRVMGFNGGFGCGSHAQYLTRKETHPIIIIPDNLNYEEAAACIEGAIYALCAPNLNPRADQTALVIGATGAIGSSMVQYLKLKGTNITAVCNNEYTELIKSLGADKVIDYKKEDFTKVNEKFDFVFDAVAKSSFFKCKPILKKNGIFTSAGGAENLFLVLITPLLGGKKVVFRPAKSIKKALSYIKGLIENGSFKPVIDRKYPLEQIAEAYTYVLGGEKIGNVIITMEVPPPAAFIS